MVTGIGAVFCIIGFVLIVTSPLFILLIWHLSSKATYKVTYKRIGLCVYTLTTYIKGRGLADIQKKLEEQHAPWDVVILSIEEVR